MAHQNRWFAAALLQLIADGLGVRLQCHSISRHPILPISGQIKTHRLVTFPLKHVGTSVPAPPIVSCCPSARKTCEAISDIGLLPGLQRFDLYGNKSYMLLTSGAKDIEGNLAVALSYAEPLSLYGDVNARAAEQLLRGSAARVSPIGTSRLPRGTQNR